MQPTRLLILIMVVFVAGCQSRNAQLPQAADSSRVSQDADVNAFVPGYVPITPRIVLTGNINGKLCAMIDCGSTDKVKRGMRYVVYRPPNTWVGNLDIQCVYARTSWATWGLTGQQPKRGDLLIPMPRDDERDQRSSAFVP